MIAGTSRGKEGSRTQDGVPPSPPARFVFEPTGVEPPLLHLSFVKAGKTRKDCRAEVPAERTGIGAAGRRRSVVFGRGVGAGFQTNFFRRRLGLAFGQGFASHLVEDDFEFD